MLLAGFETSANLLAFIVYNLAKHPAEAAKLQAELDNVKGACRPFGHMACLLGRLSSCFMVTRRNCMPTPVSSSIADYTHTELGM